MKLYLSSLTAPNEQALLDLLPAGRPLRVAVIPNAWDVYPDERRVHELRTVSGQLEKMGLSPTTVDLNKYVEEALGDELPRYEAVYVMGGNTFHLADLMQRSGFYDLIRPLLEGGVVYAGESAGAVIAGPTLRGVQHLDDPSALGQ
jgi:dipeptidase E